jgi:hypothetical protein
VKKSAREIEIDEVLPAGEVRRSTPTTGAQDPLIALIARLMDSAFKVPGTKIRFGLDPIIGLIPGLGDTAGALVSALMILQSSRHGVPKIVMARMAANVLVNSFVGSVPVLGDLFSVYFKSNKKNYELLQRHAGTQRKSTAGDWFFVVALLGGMLLVVALIVIGAITLVTKLFSSGA